MEFHEVANIFPLLTGNEFESLRDDIKTNGLLEPIVIHEGKILDGRNRYTACLGADVFPDTIAYVGDDPIGFVLSKNLHRRHLNESQRGLVSHKIENMPQSPGINQYEVDANLHRPTTRKEAAEMMNVSERTVASVAKVERDAPDLIPAIESGEMTVNRAAQTAKQRKKKEEVEAYSFEVISKPALEKKYNVVYADPPWQYNTGINTLDAVTDAHYSTMNLEAVCKYPASLGLNVQDNAVLFLWVTNPFLVKALDVVKAWGFEYKSQIVWIKTDLKRPGVGYYVRGRHEMLWICTRGSFTPLDKNISPPIGSVLEAPVREHSKKPDEAYSIIETLYPNCTYVELFARGKRDGWESFGDESE